MNLYSNKGDGKRLGFRSFLEQLTKSGELTRIRKEVSTEYEMAGIIEALSEKPVFFEKVKESSMPVVGGLVSSMDLIAKSFGVSKTDVIKKLYEAMTNPIEPEIVNKGECQEVVEKNNLTKRLE